MKKDPKPARSVITWILIVLAAHLAASLIFGVTLNIMVDNLWLEGNQDRAIGAVVVYGIVFQLVFSIAYTLISSRTIDFHESLKAEIREKTPLPVIYKDLYLKKLVYEAPVYLAVLIPYTIFFAVQKTLDLANTFAFEKFYISDMWAYLLTRNAFLGLILSVLLFVVILYAVRFVILAVMRKNLIENSVTLGE